MTKQLHTFFAVLILFFSYTASAQFKASDVKFWVGSGADTSFLVIDFHDGSWDTSYVWGYLYDGPATGSNVLADVASADHNLTIDISGGFLSDLTYGNHAGIGGTNGFYWSTWSGEDITDLETNNGLETELSNGGWFGCAFTDFNPAIAPGNPIPAFDPLYFTAKDVDFWVGDGPDTTLLVIDFHDSSTGPSSFAWGYLHAGQATIEEILTNVAAADNDLFATIDGDILHLITYLGFTGVEDDPHSWSVWHGTNLGDWDFIDAPSTQFVNGSILGFSYSDNNPALRPGYPVPASQPIRTEKHRPKIDFQTFPNPATDMIYVDLNNAAGQSFTLQLSDVTGMQIWKQSVNASSIQIPVSHLPNGIYLITLTNGDYQNSKTFIKH